jgi:hypothetical protein
LPEHPNPGRTLTNGARVSLVVGQGRKTLTLSRASEPRRIHAVKRIHCGAARVGIVHHNTSGEVGRLLDVLGEL